MKQYLELLEDVLHNGDKRVDRTGVGTLAVFNRVVSFDLQNGFPAVTTKKLYFKSVAAELAGFLEATTSLNRMQELGTNIWNANCKADYWQNNPNCTSPNDLGKIYGYQWRRWGNTELDQLWQIISRIKTNPTDRRLIVTAWNPEELDKGCLPPCHIMFQFFIRNECFLDCDFTIRSVDLFLGAPFDIASYALLTHIVAKETGYKPGILTMSSKDTHIYLNHIDQVTEQLKRSPIKLPTLSLQNNATINNFKPSMARLIDYKYHPTIKAPMAV